jgi:hypothetical protein
MTAGCSLRAWPEQACLDFGRRRRRRRPALGDCGGHQHRAALIIMVVTGLHWSAMPPSRVETIDVNTVHLQGEFVESKLGTTMQPDGKVVVRLIIDPANR